MRRKFVWTGIATISLIGMTGCSSASSPSPQSPNVQSEGSFSTEEFWGTYSRASAMEVQPAESLNDLADRSASIIKGKVIDAEPGPGNPVKLDDGTVDKNATTILTVQVEEVVSGESTDTVKVWVSSNDSSIDSAPASRMPTESYLWFLKPSEQPGIMYATTKVGIVGEDSSGDLTALLSPTDTETIISEEDTSLQKLSENVAVLSEQ